MGSYGLYKAFWVLDLSSSSVFVFLDPQLLLKGGWKDRGAAPETSSNAKHDSKEAGGVGDMPQDVQQIQ